MTQIGLTLYANPGAAEIFCRLQLRDGSSHRFVAMVDTGAQLSVLPIELLDYAQLQTDKTTRVEIEQAGIAKQAFEAVEAFVLLQFEDINDNLSPLQPVPVWFAPTEQALIGFDGVIDRSVLHIDMPAHDGWLQIS